MILKIAPQLSKRMFGIFCACALVSGYASVALSSPAPPSSVVKPLEALEREKLRYRLETLQSDADLLIRNHKADLVDLERQARQAEFLKISERIPQKPDLAGLRSQLEKFSREAGMELAGFRDLRRKPAKNPVIPTTVFSDAGGFKLSDDQLAEIIPIEIRIKADSQEKVRQWATSWKDYLVRLTIPQGGFANPMIFPQGQAAGRGIFRLTATTYRFREIEFPKIILRDPSQVLPAWAQADPAAFAKAEPKLWEILERTQKLRPQAQPLMETRRRFLLNQARLDFLSARTRG